MIRSGQKMKILLYEKCSCCNRCYIFYIDVKSGILSMVVLAQGSKSQGFQALNDWLRNGNITPEEYRDFGQRVAASDLPEHVSNEEFADIERRHVNNPQFMAGLKDMVMMLHVPADKPAN